MANAMSRFAEDFEDLEVWGEARRLANLIFDDFEKLPVFGFRDQILNASTSVMNNIAEGFDRHSRKDFARFLDIAKGSSGEVRSMLYLAEDRRYITSADAEPIRNAYKLLSSRIGALAASLRR
jgi:four helix bundle protein